MKNQYIKPVFAVELFSGAQTTTRDCWESIKAENVTFSDLPGCAYEITPGVFLFQMNGSATACTEDGELHEGLCYNNPGEGQYMFRS